MEMLMILPTLLISLTFHEYMHGLAAYKLGDPTAKKYGRLTLNPIPHIDPLGALCMLFVHFGWAKPVPVNPYYFKKPKRDMALVSICGPLANLLLTIIGLFLYYFSAWVSFKMPMSEPVSVISSMAEFFVIINFNLFLFNLIPIPPLDGSKVLYALLPEKAYWGYMKYERYGSAVLILLVFLSYISPTMDVFFYMNQLSIWIINHILGVPVKFLFSLVGIRI